MKKAFTLLINAIILYALIGVVIAIIKIVLGHDHALAAVVLFLTSLVIVVWSNYYQEHHGTKDT